ncbi:MAG: hypothetical protein LIO75_08020, partial [Lachnospiraceae bacterium]|nr:hypothetical protein [Lachnospiraceae bacterium]
VEQAGLRVRAATVGGGGGASGSSDPVLLTLTEDLNLFMVGMFTVICLAAGCVLMLLKYRKEI